MSQSKIENQWIKTQVKEINSSINKHFSTWELPDVTSLMEVKPSDKAQTTLHYLDNLGELVKDDLNSEGIVTEKNEETLAGLTSSKWLKVAKKLLEKNCFQGAFVIIKSFLEFGFDSETIALTLYNNFKDITPQYKFLFDGNNNFKKPFEIIEDDFRSKSKFKSFSTTAKAKEINSIVLQLFSDIKLDDVLIMDKRPSLSIKKFTEYHENLIKNMKEDLKTNSPEPAKKWLRVIQKLLENNCFHTASMLAGAFHQFEVDYVYLYKSHRFPQDTIQLIEKYLGIFGGLYNFKAFKELYKNQLMSEIHIPLLNVVFRELGNYKESLENNATLMKEKASIEEAKSNLNQLENDSKLNDLISLLKNYEQSIFWYEELLLQKVERHEIFENEGKKIKELTIQLNEKGPVDNYDLTYIELLTEYENILRSYKDKIYIKDSNLKDPIQTEKNIEIIELTKSSLEDMELQLKKFEEENEKGIKNLEILAGYRKVMKKYRKALGEVNEKNELMNIMKKEQEKIIEDSTPLQIKNYAEALENYHASQVGRNETIESGDQYEAKYQRNLGNLKTMLKEIEPKKSDSSEEKSVSFEESKKLDKRIILKGRKERRSITVGSKDKLVKDFSENDKEEKFIKRKTSKIGLKVHRNKSRSLGYEKQEVQEAIKIEKKGTEENQQQPQKTSLEKKEKRNIRNSVRGGTLRTKKSVKRKSIIIEKRNETPSITKRSTKGLGLFDGNTKGEIDNSKKKIRRNLKSVQLIRNKDGEFEETKQQISLVRNKSPQDRKREKSPKLFQESTNNSGQQPEQNKEDSTNKLV